jgi:hypothetical protein
LSACVQSFTAVISSLNSRRTGALEENIGRSLRSCPQASDRRAPHCSLVTAHCSLFPAPINDPPLRFSGH